MRFAMTFQSPVCILSAETTKASRLPRRARRAGRTHQFALTSASLRVTRAVPRSRGDPVASCTDLNVTALSAARPSYFSTWRVGVFFKVGEGWGGGRGGGGVLALGWVSPPPSASSRCCCRGACLPRCPERRGSAACRHTCARRATNLCRQGRQAAAARLPVSHRYTPSRRAPHFLYHLITPKGCLRRAPRLPSSLLQTLAAPTGATLAGRPAAAQRLRLLPSACSCN